MKIPRRTQSEMREHLDNWKVSGLTKHAYSLQNNITYYSFLYWCDKLEPRTTTKSFSQVKINPKDIQAVEEKVLEKIKYPFDGI